MSLASWRMPTLGLIQHLAAGKCCRESVVGLDAEVFCDCLEECRVQPTDAVDCLGR